MVDVERRAGAVGCQVLDDGDPASGRLRRGLDGGERAEEPEGLALAVPADGGWITLHASLPDHVKSLFEKLGVASRQELVARVFLEERRG